MTATRTTVEIERDLLEAVAEALVDAGHLDLFVKCATHVQNGETVENIRGFHLGEIKARVDRCARLSHDLHAALAAEADKDKDKGEESGQ